MHIGSEDLMRRMSAISADELRAIIDAAEGDYPSAAREAAQLALATKVQSRDNSDDAITEAVSQSSEQGPEQFFKNAHALARLTQSFIVISVIVHIATVAYALLNNGDTESISIVTPLGCSSAGWFALVDLPVGIAFCCWWYRVATNLRALHAQQLTYTPAEAVRAFFIPFINIVKPEYVGQEIWKASDPSLINNDLSARRRLAPSRSVSLWWTTFVLAGLVRSCRISIGSQPNSKPSATLVALAYLLFSIAGIAAIRLISEIQWRQTARRNNMGPIQTEISSAELPQPTA
jgi:hypothetical protein